MSYHKILMLILMMMVMDRVDDTNAPHASLAPLSPEGDRQEGMDRGGV